MNPDALRILLVGNYPPDRQESMQRFADVFLRGLPPVGVKVELIRPEIVWNRRAGSPGIAKWLGYVDKYLAFPKRLRRHIAASRPDVVHVCDHSNSMYLRSAPAGRRLITCHDLLAVRSALGEIPQNPTRFTGRKLQTWIQSALAGADLIVADSHATGMDVERLIALPPSRLSVVHVGLNHPYRRRTDPEISTALERNGVQRPYLFHVGGNQWYKNRPGVLRIVAGALASMEAKPMLVMAGKAPTPELRSLENRLGLGVHWIKDCDNDTLECLYSGASMLVFPSLLEGFGWPIAEAMACGTPVLTSRRASMTEVGGDLAYYVDPADERGASAILASALDDPDLPRRAAAGPEWVRQFSPSRMLEQYVALYRRLASAAPQNG